VCDTFVVVSSRGVVFGKNSDRDANEAQVLDWRPRRKHPAGSVVRCTWLEVPQASRTHAALLSRPFWTWGAEVGANEHGLVIGNEAVFTRAPRQEVGLTGMDLVRLALERAKDADEALHAITSLLTEHGQGGGCGFEDPSFTYDNSFLIADPRGAWVLETAGRRWAVERVSGTRSISNGLTISGFAEAHGQRLRTAVAQAARRRRRVEGRAKDVQDVRGAVRVLRDHGGRDWPRYRSLTGTLGVPCMHGGGLLANAVTTASWVSELGERAIRHWATATSSPCLSLYKPVAVEEPLGRGPWAGGRADGWWTHERLHRAVLFDPARLAPRLLRERDQVEAAWFADPPPSAAAFEAFERRSEVWLAGVGAPTPDRRPLWARRYWRRRAADAEAARGAALREREDCLRGVGRPL
jgi:hypothetical protein